jgi:CubicO group peptidase (beta-lactamase class C family)
MLKLSLKTILVTTLLLLLTSCEKAPEPGPVADVVKVDVEALGFSADGIEALSRYVVAKSTHSMRVTVDGQLLFEYGPQDETSYIASVRKSVLAMLYGPYVADGTIDLDATLEDLGIDDIGGLLPIEKQATVRDLISARSGAYHVASNGGDNIFCTTTGISTPPAPFLRN